MNTSSLFISHSAHQLQIILRESTTMHSRWVKELLKADNKSSKMVSSRTTCAQYLHTKAHQPTRMHNFNMHLCVGICTPSQASPKPVCERNHPSTARHLRNLCSFISIILCVCDSVGEHRGRFFLDWNAVGCVDIWVGPSVLLLMTVYTLSWTRLLLRLCAFGSVVDFWMRTDCCGLLHLQ